MRLDSPVTAVMVRLCCFGTRSATLPGLRAEEGLHQRSSGAQPHPAWRHPPEGGAGGEPEELPEEGRSPGAAGGVSEGQGGASVRSCSLGGKHSALLSVLQEELGVMQTQLSQLDARRQRAPQEGPR